MFFLFSCKERTNLAEYNFYPYFYSIVIKDHLHWQCFTAILLTTVKRDSHYLLALATLGEATQIEMILIAKVSNEGNIALQYHVHFCTQTLLM